MTPPHLIPEEEVALAELEVLQCLGLVEGDPHGVEAREEPAPAGALLVCDGFRLFDLREDIVPRQMHSRQKAPREVPCGCRHGWFFPQPSCSTRPREGTSWRRGFGQAGFSGRS